MIILNRGDIITVKCVVKIGSEDWGNGMAYVQPLNSYKDFSVTSENFDRVVRRHFEVGQTVSKKHEHRAMLEAGVIEHITENGDYLIVNAGKVEPQVWFAEHCEPVAPEVEAVEPPDFAEVVA